MAFIEARAVLQPVRLWLLPVLMAASPAIALVGPRSVPVHVITIGLAAALAAWTGDPRKPPPHGGLSARAAIRKWLTDPVPLAVAGLLAIAWLSEAWSINPGYGALSAARLTGLAAAGLFALAALSGLDAQQRHRAVSALAWGGVLLAVLYIANTATGGAIVIHLRHYIKGDPIALPEVFRLPTRASAIIAVTLWPLALVIARRFDWRLAPALVALLGLCALALPMRTIMLALLVGLVAWAVARWGHRQIPLMAGILLALAIVVLPPTLGQPTPRAWIGNAASPEIDRSVAHRFKIWEFTLSKIAERPWLGWGLAASRELASTVDPEIREPWGPGISVLPLHPHNNVLQIWLELGVLGSIAFAALCAAVGWKISRLGHDPAWRACAFAAFASYMAIGGLSYGVTQTWWVATAWLAAAILFVIRPSSGSSA